MKGRYWGPDGGRKQTGRGTVCLCEAGGPNIKHRTKPPPTAIGEEGWVAAWAPLLYKETGALNVCPTRGQEAEAVSAQAPSLVQSRRKRLKRKGKENYT